LTILRLRDLAFKIIMEHGRRDFDSIKVAELIICGSWEHSALVVIINTKLTKVPKYIGKIAANRQFR